MNDDDLTSENDEAKLVSESLGSEDENKSTSLKVFKRTRSKKAVLFADGIKPGEGTSPSGGEGDAPSPPPTSSNLPPDLTLDISKKLRSKKLRKKQKHSKPVKTKKKIKVRQTCSVLYYLSHIIKLHIKAYSKCSVFSI